MVGERMFRGRDEDSVCIRAWERLGRGLNERAGFDEWERTVEVTGRYLRSGKTSLEDGSWRKKKAPVSGGLPIFSAQKGCG